MYLAEDLQKKWGPVLTHEDLPPIKDNYRKAVTAVLLENQEKAMREQASQGSGVFGNIEEAARGFAVRFSSETGRWSKPALK